MRSAGETRLLKLVAERRARAGWSRPDISRAYGVSVDTLARWAFAGGWRDKDLAAKRDAERSHGEDEQQPQ